jgi:hypothetical protein
MIRHKVDWELPLDLSSVQAVLLYRRMDDGTCSTEEECCEFTLGGDLILVDENAPFANQYIDLVAEIGEYRYSAFSRSFTGEIAPCATTTIVVSETVSLKILNYDDRGEIIGGTSLGNTDTYKEYKTNYEFIYDIKSIVNLRDLIKPKIGWVIKSVRYEDSDLTGSELSTFYIDKDSELEVIYKQQTLKFKVEDDEESFLAYYPEEPLYAPAWTEQSIVAIPKDCYDFVRWEGGPEDQDAFDATDSDTKFILDKSYTFKAIGEKTKYLVDVQVDEERGYVTESGEYTCDDLIYITADANEGYRFKRWSILKGSENIVRQYDEEGEEIPLILESKTLEFYVTGPVVIKAIIEKIYILDLSWNNQWGITDPVEDQYLDAEDNSTKIAAVPREGGVFLRWKIMSGGENIISEFDLMDKNPQLIMISGDVGLQAIFSEIYDLEVQLYLSRSYCKGTDCGRVIEHERFAKVSGGGSGYHLENNIAEISISDVIEGYEFVGWQVVTGGENVSQLESMEEVQNVTLLGDATLRAVIQLVPHSIHVYPNFKILGSVIPRNKKNVTIRDVINIAAAPRTARIEFYTWRIVVGSDHIIPYQSDVFELTDSDVQKFRINSDVEIEAIFEKTYFLELTYKAYGFNGRDVGPNTVSNAYENIELLEIRSPGRNTSFAGFFTKRDAVQIISNCKKQIPCVYEKDGKTSMFVFTEWKQIKNEDGIAPTTFSPQQDQQMLTLTSDLILEAQLFQLYNLKIEYSTTDTSVGTFSGEGIYRCDESGFASAPITASGQISDIPVPSGPLDELRPRLYEFDRWEVRMDPGEYRVSSFDKKVANQTIEMGSDLILRVYFLVPWELKLEPFVFGLTGMSEFTQQRIIKALGNANLKQSGDGTYRETEETEIWTESPNLDAFEFKEWSVEYHEGSVQWPVRADLSEQAQRIKIKKDTLLLANYELIYYNFSRGVNGHQPTGGNVNNTTLDGSYHYFEKISLEAEANQGYEFEEWLITEAIVEGVNAEGEDIYKKPQKWKTSLNYRKNRLIDIGLNGDLRMEAVFLLQYIFNTWDTREVWSDPNRKIDNTFVRIEKKEPYRDNPYNKITFNWRPDSSSSSPVEYKFVRWIIIGDSNFEGDINLEDSGSQTIYLTGDFTIVAEVIQVSKLNIRLIPSQELRSGTIKSVRSVGYTDKPENLQVFSRYDYAYIEKFELFYLQAREIIEEDPEVLAPMRYYTGEDQFINNVVGAEDPDEVSLGDGGKGVQLSLGIGNDLWEVNTTKMITKERLESGMPNMLSAQGKNYIPNQISGDLSEYHSPHTLQIRATYKEKIKLDIIDQNDLIDFQKWEIHPEADLSGFNVNSESQEGFNLLDNSTVYLYVKPKQYSLEIAVPKKVQPCGERIASNTIAFASNYFHAKLIGTRARSRSKSYIWYTTNEGFNNSTFEPAKIYNDVFENLEEINTFTAGVPYIDLSGYKCTGKCQDSVAHSIYRQNGNRINSFRGGNGLFIPSYGRYLKDLGAGFLIKSDITLALNSATALYLNQDYTVSSDGKKYFGADEDILVKAWPSIDDIKKSLPTEKNLGFNKSQQRNEKFQHVFKEWKPVGVEEIESFGAQQDLQKSSFVINGLRENIKLAAKFQPVYYLCIRQLDDLRIKNYSIILSGSQERLNDRIINLRVNSSWDPTDFDRESDMWPERGAFFSVGEFSPPANWPNGTNMTDEQMELFGIFRNTVIKRSVDPNLFYTQEHKDCLQFLSRSNNPNKIEKTFIRELNNGNTREFKYTEYDYSSLVTLDNKADTFIAVTAEEIKNGLSIVPLGYNVPDGKVLSLDHSSDTKQIFDHEKSQDISGPHVHIKMNQSVCRRLKAGDVIYIDVRAKIVEPLYVGWTLDKYSHGLLTEYNVGRQKLYLKYPTKFLSTTPWISITPINAPINYKVTRGKRLDGPYGQRDAYRDSFKNSDEELYGDIGEPSQLYARFSFDSDAVFKIDVDRSFLTSKGFTLSNIRYYSDTTGPSLINADNGVKYINDNAEPSDTRVKLSEASSSVSFFGGATRFKKSYFDAINYPIDGNLLYFQLSALMFSVYVEYVKPNGTLIPLALRSGMSLKRVDRLHLRIPATSLIDESGNPQQIKIPYWYFAHTGNANDAINTYIPDEEVDGNWLANWNLYSQIAPPGPRRVSDFWTMVGYNQSTRYSRSVPNLLQQVDLARSGTRSKPLFKNSEITRHVLYNGVNVGKKHSAAGVNFELVDNASGVFLEEDIPYVNYMNLKVDFSKIASHSLTIRNVIKGKDFDFRIRKSVGVNTNITYKDEPITNHMNDTIIELDPEKGTLRFKLKFE